MTGGGRTNVWDSQNRLQSCTYNGTTTTNTYASDGLRHGMVSGGTTTDYAYDATMMVREFTGTGTVKATYLPGPRGVEYRRDDVAGTVRWYVYDGLGSVMGEVSPDGTLTRTQSFDVYGAVRTSSGTASTKHKFVGSLGHPSDDETGLIYMRARYYDPVCGRFVSEDPGRDGANWFAYCGSNPVNRLDANGKVMGPGTDLFIFFVVLCIAGAIMVFLDPLIGAVVGVVLLVLASLWIIADAADTGKGVGNGLKKRMEEQMRSGGEQVMLDDFSTAISAVKTSSGPGSDAAKVGAHMVELEFYLALTDIC